MSRRSHRSVMLSTVLLLLFGLIIPVSATSPGAAPAARRTACKPTPCDSDGDATIAAQVGIFNSRLAAQVGPNGIFNIGADPDAVTGGSSAASWNLLYSWPRTPYSSFSTIRIDGVNHIYGSSGEVVRPPTTVDARTTESAWQIGDVEVAQVLQLVPNPQTGQDDIVKISYTVTNHGLQPHSAGTRILLDTEINYNDGAPFRVPGAGIVTKERDFYGSAIPDTFQSFFAVDNSQHVAVSALKSGVPIPPDRLVFAKWLHLYRAIYDYTINPAHDFTNRAFGTPDSAYAVYWREQPLAPSESRTYVTYYGRAELDADLRPPLALTVSSPTALTIADNQYAPNPFDIVATVLNNGTAPATDVTVDLTLPAGLTLVPGTVNPVIDALPVGQERQVSWRVQAAAQRSATTLTYAVVADASNAEPKRVERPLTVPALGAPVEVTITDADGVPVTALSTNAEGWLSPNPLKVTVMVKNPGAEAGAFFVPVTLGSPNHSTRFWVFNQPPASTGSGALPSCVVEDVDARDNSYSFRRYDARCDVRLAAGESRSFTWDVWLQPSVEGPFNAAAALEPVLAASPIAEAQAQIVVPLAAIHPVLLVPGITATEPAVTAGPFEADTFLFGADTLANYNDFYTALEKLGYQKNQTYFRFPWDWLTDATRVAAEMPRVVFGPSAQLAVNHPFVAADANRSAESVTFDIVAHSGGAVLTRAYLQTPAYRGYVHRVVSVGGTHKGLTEAYNLLEGELTEWTRGTLATIVDANVLLRATAVGGYATVHCRRGIGRVVICVPGMNATEKYAFGHDPFNGGTLVPQILPTEGTPYLKSSRTGQVFPFGRIANPLLEPASVVTGQHPVPGAVLDPYTNAFVQREVLDQRFPGRAFSTTYWGLNTSASMQHLVNRIGSESVCVIYGTNNPDNRVELMVADPRLRQPAPHWLNGRQVDQVQGAGDGLVPTGSANPTDIWAGAQRFNYRLQQFTVHAKMVGYDETAREVARCFLGDSQAPPFLAGAINGLGMAEADNLSAQADEQPALPRKLMIVARGPVRLMLTDAQGRRLGSNPASSTPFAAIPGGTSATVAERGEQYLTITDPEVGDQTLTIVGTGSGAYTVTGAYYDQTGVAGLFVTEGQATAGSQATETVTVPAQAIDSPQPPLVSAGLRQTVTVRQPITFAGAFTDLNPADTHTISWDFGDNSRASGVLTPSHTYTQAGTYRATLTVTDTTGFTGDETVAITVVPAQADTTPPTITVSGVADTGRYALGSVPTASCTAVDEAGGSGVEGSCAGTLAGGTPNGVGTYTYTATARDRAGNVATRSSTYRVVYRWDGFLQPIDDPARDPGATTSIFRAGSTVPVKFQLKRADGTVVAANSLPVWLLPVEEETTSAPIDETVSASPPSSGTAYRWDSTRAQYIAPWATEREQRGRIWRIGVILDDGETYYVLVGLR